MTAACERRRVSVVTGGTDGIGKEVARGLAAAGDRVVIVGRDLDKGCTSEREIRHTTSNPDVRFVAADLSLIREAVRLGNTIAEWFPAVDRLVLGAGFVRGRHELTAEGIESNFAVNYLSRFALTLRLLESLRAAASDAGPARVLLIGGAAKGRMYFEDVQLTSRFTTLRAVRQFCRANDLFSIELARRLTERCDRRVTVTCLKVGVVRTNVRRELPRWMRWLVPLALDPVIALRPEQAASSALALLLDQAFEGVSGERFSLVRRLRRLPSEGEFLPAPEGERLWQLSERLTRVAMKERACVEMRATF